MPRGPREAAARNTAGDCRQPPQAFRPSNRAEKRVIRGELCGGCVYTVGWPGVVTPHRPTFVGVQLVRYLVCSGGMEGSIGLQIVRCEIRRSSATSFWDQTMHISVTMRCGGSWLTCWLRAIVDREPCRVDIDRCVQKVRSWSPICNEELG